MSALALSKSSRSLQWRVPTRSDCKKLFEGGEHRSCVFINDLKFLCWLSGKPKSNKSEEAYFAHFASGSTSTQSISAKMAVRLVRDVTMEEVSDAFSGVPGRFALTQCKTAVIDRETRIAWRRRTIRPQLPWELAIKQALRLVGGEQN